MTSLRRRVLHTLALLSVGALPLAGCSDSFTGAEQPLSSAPAGASKLRQAQLFGAPESAGKIFEEWSILSTSTDFVVGYGDATLEASWFKILEEYDLEEGVTVKRSFRKAVRGFSMHVDPLHVERILNKIEADPNIAWIQPDARIAGNPQIALSPLSGWQLLPWNIRAIGAGASSTKAGNGEGAVAVDLYVLDSGISSADLNVVESQNFVAGGAAEPDRSHGTHVAGTAAAIDNDAQVVGAAPGARIHDFRVLDPDGLSDLSTVISAVDLITQRKLASPATPMVVNISFGGRTGSARYNALDDAIVASIDAGVVYVVAAGNYGEDVSLFSPAHVAEAITVAAHDELNAFSLFSNRGALVDLVAPGANILSTMPSGGSLATMSGTSMAAPHVAGAAALYLSKQPGATPQQVRDALVSNGRANVGFAPPGTTNRSVYVGTF